MVELVLLALLGWCVFLFLSMLRRNRNPLNQRCSDEIVEFILSGHFHETESNIRGLKNIIENYHFDKLDGPHIASLVEVKLRSQNAYSDSVKQLLKHLYL